MAMLEQLSKSMIQALDAIRSGKAPSGAHSNTIDGLLSRALISSTFEHQFEIGAPYVLSPVGETVYFEYEVMSQQQASDFQPGQSVQYLKWTCIHTWMFEWQDATVERVTKAFVFIKFVDEAHNWRFTDGQTPRCKPTLIRHKPVEISERELDAIIVDGNFRLAPYDLAVPNRKPFNFYSTDFEPYIPEPRLVNDLMSAVTAVCSACGCQYDAIWFSDWQNTWEHANRVSLCGVCLWTTCALCRKELPANTHSIVCALCETNLEEPLVSEPRMVNDKLIAVTGVCEVCRCQYDEIFPFSVLERFPERPWRWAHISSRCSFCEKNNCYECRKPLPEADVLRAMGYCNECNVQPLPDGSTARNIQLGYENSYNLFANLLPAICVEYPLLATFLQGGENAIHFLWACYAGHIATALMDYKRMPSENELYKRAWRSAAAILYMRFEEEYLRLVDRGGHGEDADVLFHLLPINAQMDVLRWMHEYGEFEYPAQIFGMRQIARDHAVYVDPIPTRISPAEYRAEDYGRKQRAGVCRVWWHGSTKHLVEHVTRDQERNIWYVHAHKFAVPMPMLFDEYLTVEELLPARINDRVQRLDDGQFGTVIGVSGGALWVKPDLGDTQPHWKRIHVDVIYPPDDSEFDRQFNEAVKEAFPASAPPQIVKLVMPSAQSGDQIRYTCGMIRNRLDGMRVGLIKSVTHLRESLYRVEFVHGVPLLALKRIKFLHTVQNVGKDTLEIDLSLSPFWRRSQPAEALQFQARLDNAGITLEARYSAFAGLLVHHPLADVLERLLPSVRKLAGVSNVFYMADKDANPHYAAVKLSEKESV